MNERINKRTGSGKNCHVSLWSPSSFITSSSTLTLNILLPSDFPKPLWSPLGPERPLSLPSCCLLLWVRQIGDVSHLKPTIPEAGAGSSPQGHLAGRQSGRQPWPPRLSWDLCPALPRILTQGATHNPQLTVCPVQCFLFYGHRRGCEYQPAHTTAHTNILFSQGWLNQQGGEP
ncbi:unnamed protein product [Rangifer tarandus platyrhynchus]|uniref:Uncharacterized protein n=1 Tax=Rangifer tarandus platyrhynchus TaxID=3082113 RepID=A0AC59ZY19_RANTA